MSLLISNINKSFSGVQAVQNLSMEVQEGEIFGFIGPNGAGKTTTIRIILDIIRPDQGEISWNSRPIRGILRKFWGYLPEERGLYPKMAVDDQLIFLARLYGTPKEVARRELDYWLQRFQIAEYRHKPVEELSKGNQQKIQFLAAILHDPQILIMDEPFSGLDPLNVNLLKDALLEMHERGKTIIFSTHQMEQVEELCHSVVLINKGQSILSGSVREVRQSNGRKIIRLALSNDPELHWLDTIVGVTVIKRREDYVELNLAPEVSPEYILHLALQQPGQITRFELAEPSLNDIFIERVTGKFQPEMPRPEASLALH